jgi:hypothetical protein
MTRYYEVMKRIVMMSMMVRMKVIRDDDNEK